MKAKKTIRPLIGGLGIGTITGLLGGGGGMLAVPMLGSLGLGAKQAHATAILVILPVTVVGALFYLGGGYVAAAPLGWAGVGIVLGGALGAVLLARLDSAVVRIVFAVVMTAVGLRLAAAF